MKYGVLKSSINTGLDSELQYTFLTPLSITSNQPAFSHDTMNLRRKVFKQNVQRWEIEAEIEYANDSRSANFFVHSVMSGNTERVYVRMPQVYNLNTSSATIEVGNTLSRGTNIMSITGANSMVYGEFIKFGNHDKVYLVIDGGSGGNDVKIFPSLLADVPVGTSINTTIVTMRAYYDSDVIFGLRYSDGIMTKPGSIKLVEAL